MSYTGPDFVNGGAPAINAANLNGIVTELERCSVLGDETVNIRTGADGTVYSSAGNAVRGQISDIYTALNEILSVKFGSRGYGSTEVAFTFVQGKTYIFTNTSENASATINASTKLNGETVQTIKIGIAKGEKVVFTASGNADTLRMYFNAAGSFRIEYNLPFLNADKITELFQLKTTEETDGNNIRTSGYYLISSSKTNIPEASGVLIVYKGSDNHYQTYQIFISYADKHVYVRNEMGNGTWSAWFRLDNWDFKTTSQTDLNNIIDSGFYTCNYNWNNLPKSGDGCLLLVYRRTQNSQFATYQMAITYNEHLFFVRNKVNGVWSEWSRVSRDFGTKNIAWFGDSVSSLKPLPKDASLLISASAHNFAIPGAVYDKQTSGNWPYEYLGFASLMTCMDDNDYTNVDTAVAEFLERDPNWKYADEMEDFKTLDWTKIDTAVVFYGTNDYTASVVTIEQFKADITSALVKLITNHPLVRIYCITPMYRTDWSTVNSQGKNLLDYVNAIIEVANSLNIPVLDLFHNCRINEHNSNTFLINDGLHQNDNGELLLSQEIAKFLNSF